MEYVNSDISLQGDPVIQENLIENFQGYNTIVPMNYSTVLPSMDNTTDNFYYLVDNCELGQKAYNYYMKCDSVELASINLVSLTKSQILDSFSDPKAINFWSLPSFIKNLEDSGFSAIRHKLFHNSEMARPFFLIAMFLIGAIFALKHSKFSHTSILILTSISSGFVLFSIKRIAESFGSVQEIPIIMATFGPSISGILICLGFLLHFEDG